MHTSGRLRSGRADPQYVREFLKTTERKLAYLETAGESDSSYAASLRNGAEYARALLEQPEAAGEPLLDSARQDRG